jgi:uncharacterized protein YukE
MTTPGGQALKVEPSVLRSTGAQFERVGDTLSDLRAGEPLSAAAAGVSQLATGPACLKAAENIATQMKSLADGAHSYGNSLETAAQQYESTDQASAGALATVSFSN